MQVIKTYNNELIFDNLKSKNNRQYVSIKNEKICLDFEKIINSQFTGGNLESKYNVMKEFLNLGYHSKSPCGGFVNFYRFISDQGNYYIIYSGIKEVSNSHYVVTIHKIIADDFN